MPFRYQEQHPTWEVDDRRDIEEIEYDINYFDQMSQKYAFNKELGSEFTDILLELKSRKKSLITFYEANHGGKYERDKV